MSARKILEIGGYISGALLILFGIAAIWMGIDGRSTVRDSITQEGIVFGNAADDPAVKEHASQWSEQQVKTGDQARAFALVMREHTLESTKGLTYAQMGRFVSAANPSDPKGTSDDTAAKKDSSGQPISNTARDIWVTETALTTALNMSYMAEQLSIFGIVVGIALLLTGIGLVIISLLAVRSWASQASAAPAASRTPATA